MSTTIYSPAGHCIPQAGVINVDISTESAGIYKAWCKVYRGDMHGIRPPSNPWVVDSGRWLTQVDAIELLGSNLGGAWYATGSFHLSINGYYTLVAWIVNTLQPEALAATASTFFIGPASSSTSSGQSSSGSSTSASASSRRSASK